MNQKSQSVFSKLQRKIRLHRALKEFKKAAINASELEICSFKNTCRGFLDSCGFVPSGYPAGVAGILNRFKAVQSAKAEQQNRMLH